MKTVETSFHTTRGCSVALVANGGASDAIVIVVPMAPPRALLPNVRRKGVGGAHWSVQAQETQALRWAAKAAAVNTRGIVRIDYPVIVSYEVVWPRVRYGGKRPFPDHDAIPSSCKAILDGFVDAGLLVDDSPAYVVEVRATGHRGETGEDGCTVVTLIAA